ncbi:DUF2164 domain-containing protein [Roseibium sp. SCPC15]|uniref:DUF2164 domain-containing protein n=1 Tax=Roseibium sp. SCP15 TaxID=3141376 RepID=UPI00333C6C6C
MADIELSHQDRAALGRQVQRFVQDELDLEIGNMDAEQLVEFLVKTAGNHCYNLGLQDAQILIERKAEDISSELSAMEKLVSGE